MQPTTREWVIDTVAELPDREMKELKEYLEYLVWKSQKLRRKGQPKRILEAINKSHDVTMEDALALLQSIEEGEILMQKQKSLFDESEGKS